MVPIVLFAYRRADHLSEVLKCLRENSVPCIYAFSDGAATQSHEIGVDEVRSILKDVTWCQLRLVERPVNYGLGRSVLEGVTEVLEKHDRVIVFEDDLVAVQGCYAYLTAALDHYAEDPRVMSVTGWTHPRIVPDSVDLQPYFDGKAECWVWGAWRRSWVGMEEDALSLMRQCAAAGIDTEMYGSDLPKMAAEESKRNLWAVRWWYLHILRQGLCLRPPYSMVEHLGFDERATTSAGAIQWANPPLKPSPRIPTTWPIPTENPQCAELWRKSAGDS